MTSKVNLAALLTADRRGGWTMGWLDLGALRWILDDRSGAENAWHCAVQQRPEYRALKRDIVKLRRNLELLNEAGPAD